MIERILYEILEEGRDTLLTESGLRFLERYFLKMKKLSETEVAGILTLFQNKTPAVRHSYARSDDQVPSWNIVLANEQEEELFLGDDVGTAGELIELGVEGELEWDDTDPDSGGDLTGSIWGKHFLILTYTEHPDATRYYYEIAKLIMLRSRKYLEEEGELLGLKYSGGDLAPDPAYVPAHLFVRQFTVETQAVECAASDSSPDRFTRLDGMFVNDGVPAVQKGGVKSLVTPVTTGGTDDD